MGGKYLKPGEDFSFDPAFGFTGSHKRNDAHDAAYVSEDEFGNHDGTYVARTKKALGGALKAPHVSRLMPTERLPGQPRMPRVSAPRVFADGGDVAQDREPLITMPMSKAQQMGRALIQKGMMHGAQMGHQQALGQVTQALKAKASQPQPTMPQGMPPHAAPPPPPGGPMGAGGPPGAPMPGGMPGAPPGPPPGMPGKPPGLRHGGRAHKAGGGPMGYNGGYLPPGYGVGAFGSITDSNNSLQGTSFIPSSDPITDNDLKIAGEGMQYKARGGRIGKAKGGRMHKDMGGSTGYGNGQSGIFGAMGGSQSSQPSQTPWGTGQGNNFGPPQANSPYGAGAAMASGQPQYGMPPQGGYGMPPQGGYGTSEIGTPAISYNSNSYGGQGGASPYSPFPVPTPPWGQLNNGRGYGVDPGYASTMPQRGYDGGMGSIWSGGLQVGGPEQGAGSEQFNGYGNRQMTIDPVGWGGPAIEKATPTGNAAAQQALINLGKTAATNWDRYSDPNNYQDLVQQRDALFSQLSPDQANSAYDTMYNTTGAYDPKALQAKDTAYLASAKAPDPAHVKADIWAEQNPNQGGAQAYLDWAAKNPDAIKERASAAQWQAPGSAKGGRIGKASGGRIGKALGGVLNQNDGDTGTPGPDATNAFIRNLTGGQSSPVAQDRGRALIQSLAPPAPKTPSFQTPAMVNKPRISRPIQHRAPSDADIEALMKASAQRGGAKYENADDYAKSHAPQSDMSNDSEPSPFDMRGSDEFGDEHKRGGFIKGAIKHPGRMTNLAKKHGVSVHAEMEHDKHSKNPSLRGAANLGLRLTKGDLKRKG